jgi:hypothetical protein
MIRGLHGLFYSSEPEAARAFLRDKLKLAHTDVGEGWLIFDLPEADLGVHPVEEGQAGGGHDVSFYCDDIHGTVADLESRGVPFEQDVADHGYGYVTYFTIPGGLRVQLYEPKYQKRPASPPRKTVKKAAKTVKKAAKKAVAKVAAKAKRAVTKAKSTVKRATTRRGAATKRR